jgi:hypothetical protein
MKIKMEFRPYRLQNQPQEKPRAATSFPTVGKTTAPGFQTLELKERRHSCRCHRVTRVLSLHTKKTSRLVAAVQNCRRHSALSNRCKKEHKQIQMTEKAQHGRETVSFLSREKSCGFRADGNDIKETGYSPNRHEKH